MLAEIWNVRPIPGEGFRRWFADAYFELVVWYAENRTLKGFQLSYDKMGRERALTWTQVHGFQHSGIDADEGRGDAKATPVTVADGEFPRNAVLERFRQASARMDPDVAGFVLEMIGRYPFSATAPELVM